MKTYYELNREKCLAASKARYRDNREKCLVAIKTRYWANREKCIAASKARYQVHRSSVLSNAKIKRQLEEPTNTIRKTKRNGLYKWMPILYGARCRCRNPRHRSYKRYGGRGIKCVLTKEEIACLWVRDGAEKLRRPSLDRIDNDGNYEFNNCRFIELSDNSRRTHGYILEQDWKRIQLTWH